MEKLTKGIVIGATRSGSGKTTVALGIMAALSRRGMRVAPFKTGPDFIDPGHHGRVTGRISRNLDGWMLSRAYNRQSFQRGIKAADIAIIEGVMGLFDGYDGKTEAGSTSQMAKWLGLPVLLIVDARSMARSAAAVVLGFERFDPDLRYAGILFNNIGSPRHLDYLKDALTDITDLPCIGGIPSVPDIGIPERHLGLVTQDEHALSEEQIDRLAAVIEENADMDLLLSGLPRIETEMSATTASEKPSEARVRIGVARDEAFCFYYPDNLELLEQAGADIVFFSPIRDTRLPEHLDGLYFGGGYPELFAARLSANTGIRLDVAHLSRSGMPIYGECGGFMYLCRELRDQHGETHPMTGCFPFNTAMFPRLRSLGYREIHMAEDTFLGTRQTVVRGHEFHYSALDPETVMDTVEIRRLYRVTDRTGKRKIEEGYQVHRTLGSYIHLHFGSAPDTARSWVTACRDYQQARGSAS